MMAEANDADYGRVKELVDRYVDTISLSSSSVSWRLTAVLFGSVSFTLTSLNFVQHALCSSLSRLLL